MVEVTYYCPRCRALAALERDPYLSDKSVTPYPLEGWNYVAPDEAYERDGVDGVRFVCGESDGCTWRTPPDEGDATDDPDDGDAIGCGEPFYLNFVRYEDGEEVEPAGAREREYVELAEGRAPTGPRGPRGPPGPG